MEIEWRRDRTGRGVISEKWNSKGRGGGRDEKPDGKVRPAHPPEKTREAR
jgi:hypothetical protein